MDTNILIGASLILLIAATFASVRKLKEPSAERKQEILLAEARSALLDAEMARDEADARCAMLERRIARWSSAPGEPA